MKPLFACEYCGLTFDAANVCNAHERTHPELTAVASGKAVSWDKRDGGIPTEIELECELDDTPTTAVYRFIRTKRD